MQVPEVKYIGPKSDYSEKIIYSTVEECYEYCKDKKELAIDIETSYKYLKGTYKNENIYKPGLDPYLSVICMLQLGDEHTIFVIDVRVVDITLLLPLFKDKEKVFVGHNLKFEQKHLLHNYGILFHTIYDTMIVEQNLTNGLGWSKENPTGLLYSLEALAGRYLGIKPAVSIDLFTEINEDDEQDYIDKSIRMGFLTIGNKPFTEAQILYGSDDILYPILIKKKQAAGYNGYNPKHVHLLENKFCLVLADIEYKGMEFDKEQWTRVYQQKLVQYKHRLKKLNDYVEANYKMFCNPPDLFELKYICSIEWGSSQQVVKLFKHIGICPMEKSKQTRKMEYTVGAATLVKQLPNDYKEKYNNDEETEIVEHKDLILNYLLLKVSEQCCTTFGEEWLKYIHPITGRVHSSYKQILNTGRMSSSSPNLQNIPSEEDYRRAFKNTMINADYSSQEGRIVADLSEDEALISFFNDGHPIHGSDFHSFTGTKMFSLMRNEPDLIISKKTHPKERSAAKNVGFKINYGGTAYTLKDDLGVDEETAKLFISSYLDAFPGLKVYFDKRKKQALKDGFIVIDEITERRYWYPDFYLIKELSDKAFSYYPKNWKELSPERKEEVKAELYKQYPEIKEMWKKVSIIRGELERTAMNFPIQGTAGGQTKTAGVIFRKFQIENGLRDKVWISNLIHDEGVFECGDEETANLIRPKIEEIFKEAGKVFCKRVIMEAEATVNSWWSH